MTDTSLASTDVRLADEASHYQDLPADHLKEHFQDHIGIGIFGKAGDKDILLVCTIYHVGGRLWGIKDGGIIQTDLVVSPTDDRVMTNNPFVANRMDPIAHFDKCDVVQEADRVVWKAGNRRVICRPPYWELKGEHLGVDIDMKLTGIGTAVPYHGTWDGLAENGVAGNEQLAIAEGSVTYKGETYTLDEGWAVRERTCLGKGFDVPSLLGSKAGYIWGWCFSDALKVFCFAQGGSGHFAGRAFLKDRTIDFGADDTKVEALEWWEDPLTRLTHATSWKITMESDEGSLELKVDTWSRYIFGFHLLSGYTTHHGALGRFSGRFSPPDGEPVSIDDCIAYFEQGISTPLAAG